MTATFIGCADQIEVPDVPTSNGRIVMNQYDINSKLLPPSVKIIEQNGALVKDLGPGALGTTGSNKIVFAKWDASSGFLSEIFMSDRDGNGAKRIGGVTRPGQRLYGVPVIATDGSTVAYATRDSITQAIERRSLHVMKSDGSGHLELTDGLAYSTQFAVSPDGSRVAFFKSAPGSNWLAPADLVIARTDGTGSITIASNLNSSVDFAASIAWTPDGQRVAYGVKEASGDAAVFVVGAGGGTPQPIASGLWPAWSPNGETLAWTGFNAAKNSTEIYYSTDLGVTPVALTATADYESEPQFSLDGKTIMCTIWAEEPHQSSGRVKLINIATQQASIAADLTFSSNWIR